VRRSRWLIIIVALCTQVYAEQQQEHTKECKSCKLCDKVIDRALKFIASQQKADGRWVNDKKKEGSYQSADHTPVFTSINALALYAGGSTSKEGRYKNEIQRAKRAVIKLVQSLLQNKLNPDYHTYRYAVLFLTHVYKHEKSAELKTLLEKIRNHLVKRQFSSGGWSYGGPDEMPFMTTCTVISLMLLRQVGIKVDNKVFESARNFYTMDYLQHNEGGLVYHAKWEKIHKILKAIYKKGGLKLNPENRAGRTAAALWPMQLLGLSDSDTFRKAKKFAVKNIDEIDRSQHGPAYHLFWTALACFYGQQEGLWKKFHERFCNEIVKNQAEDGSILIKPRKNSYMPVDEEKSPLKSVGFHQTGPIYTTPKYVIILLLNRGTLLFDRLKSLSQDK